MSHGSWRLSEVILFCSASGQSATYSNRCHQTARPSLVSLQRNFSTGSYANFNLETSATSNIWRLMTHPSYKRRNHSRSWQFISYRCRRVRHSHRETYFRISSKNRNASLRLTHMINPPICLTTTKRPKQLQLFDIPSTRCG